MEDRFGPRLQHRATTVWAIRSATVGTVCSYCGPFQAVCGFDIFGELVGAGDPGVAVGLDLGGEGEGDPVAAGFAAAGGQVAALGPVVDDVGFHAEPGGDLGDGQLAGLAVVPPILDLSLLDRKIFVSNRDAIVWTKKLMEEEGLFVGVSTGAIASICVRVASELDEGNVVFVAPDDGWKYLSSGVYNKTIEQLEADGVLESGSFW